MSATVQILRLTGAGPTPTEHDITGINTRLGTKDEHTTNDLTYALQYNGNITLYSYWAVMRLKCTVSPAVTINNIKWYTDGSVFTGFTRLNVSTATGYTQATGAEGFNGTTLTVGNYPTLAGAPVNSSTYTSSSPLSVAGSISNPDTGQFGDYVVMQATTPLSVSPGVRSAETITWKYDEI